MKVIQGGREQRLAEVEKALLQYAVTGSEQDRQRVMTLDTKLGRRAQLTAVPFTPEPKP